MLKKLLILLLGAFPTFAQSPVTVTGTVTDSGNNPVTSGYVQFDITPSVSSVHYYIPNVTSVAPITTKCSINASGLVQNFALSGPCLVWGNDVIIPGNTVYKVTFAPGNVVSNTVPGELITGTTYNLNNPTFAPIVQVNPQQAVIRANPFQTNVIPTAANTFNIGSASVPWANGFFSSVTVNGTIFNPSNYAVLNGVNTFTGTSNTFSTAVNLNGGGALGGTWTGSPTLSGNPIFNGNPNFGGIPTFTGTIGGPVTFSGLITGNGGYTGIHTTLSANPAQSGIVRLATGDSWCFRNNANSGDVCVSKNASDQFLFGGNKGVTQSGAVTPGHLATWNADAVVQDGGAVPTGVPVNVSNLTGQSANVGSITLVTPGANGFFRFSCFIVETQAATTSSTLPSCQLNFTDGDSSTALVANATTFTTSATANVVGTWGVTTFPLTFFAKTGVAIQYSTVGYGSTGGIVMQYAVHVRLEGPF